MVRSKCIVSLLLTLLVCLTAASAAAAPAALPIGVVDMLYLINQHPDTPKANEALRAEQEADKKEFADKSTKLSDKERQDLGLQLGQRLEQKRQELLKPIADQVLAAIQAVAAERGLGLVVQKNAVVCGGTDITADVLKRIAGK